MGAKFYGPLWKKVGSLPPPGWEASSSLSRVVRVSEALRTVQGAVIPWSPAQEVWTPWGFFWVPLCFFQSSSAEFRLGCPGGAPKGSMRMDRHPPGEMRQSCGWVTVASANRLQCRLSNAAARALAGSCVDTTSREQPATGPGPGRWWYLSRALFYQHVREHTEGSFVARAGLHDPFQATPSQEGPQSVTSLPPLSPKSTLLAQLCALGARPQNVSHRQLVPS